MSRPGFALVFVLLITAAIELLTLSSLALATHESVIAAARWRAAIAGRNADAALAYLIQVWPHALLDSLPIGRSTAWPAENDATIEVQRTSFGSYYTVASATVGRATVKRAAVLRKLDVARGITESSEAIVSAGPIWAPLARLETNDARACTLPDFPERPPAPVTVSKQSHAFGVPEARVDSAHAIWPDAYAFAGVRWDELPSIADVQASETIHLTPADSTGTELYPLIYAPGDLTIASSNGQGLIFVHGNLQIHNDVQFNGLIVVNGTVRIGDDVRINGTLRIHGNSLSNIGRATISYAPCAIAEAMLKSPATTRVIRASRTYIPAF